MKQIKKNFRLWWQRPRPISKREPDRSVSFLELFYDLAYVVIIAELTHSLTGNFSFASLVGFGALFTLVWIAWVNGSMYHELHGNNDFRTRVFTFLQMIALTGMGIFSHNVFDDGAQGFAISYGIFLVLISILWWRTGVHDRDHRPLSIPYSTGFFTTALAFFVSAFLLSPLNFYVWGGAILFSTLLPLTLGRFVKVDPDHLEQSQAIHPSMVERFGLLRIIVLGEVLVAVVNGGRYLDLMSFNAIVGAMLSLSLVISMWWLYFDIVSHQQPIQRTWRRMMWLYLHLPATMSIALVGAGVYLLLKGFDAGIDVEVSQLLIGSIVAFLWTIVFFTMVVHTKNIFKEIHKCGARLIAFLALITPALLFLELSALELLIWLNVILIIPILRVFYKWTSVIHQYD